MNFDKTTLCIAFEKGYFDIIKLLLKKTNINVNIIMILTHIFL